MRSSFSIVITTYNRLSLLKRAINSALGQTVPCEVIVVDDCSSDGTADYICSLGGKVVFCGNSQTLGHSGSVKLGVQAAQGDWIKLLDDDDYLTPNCIEKIIEAIELHPRSVICSCQAVQVDLKEREMSRTPLIGPGKAFYIPQTDIHYGMLLEQVPFGTTSQVAFPREICLEAAAWDPNLDVCDDIDSWNKIAQFGDAIFINEYLIYRTIWHGSYNLKSSLLERLEANIAVKERIYTSVNQKYQNLIPPLSDIRHYLKLHWSLVALQKRMIVTAMIIALPALVSPAAWKLLFNAISTRKLQFKKTNICKIVLIES